MARATLSREELVARLSRVFRTHGYEGASLARLSEATGLVKASLYYQFPRGKEDMAEAVLAHLGERMRGEVLAAFAGPGTPRQRLEAGFEALAGFYDGGQQSCAIDVFGIGASGDMFRAYLAASVERLGGALAGLLRDAGIPAEFAGRRAEDALIAIQGSLVVSRATGKTAAFERVVAELPDRLLAP